MRSLVYLAPVPWSSVAQRPHKHAAWFHARHGGPVLWVDPYASRFPRWSDWRRLSTAVRDPGQPVPPWMTVISPRPLPLEPLPGSGHLNALLWRSQLRHIVEFGARSPCELVIAKPSRLALAVLTQGRFVRTTYDAMDDFPAFHGGLAGLSMAHIEQTLAAKVDCVQVSASRLEDKFARFGSRVLLVRNACDPASLPAAELVRVLRDPSLVGYVGTMAAWFDWDLVATLAAACPELRFRLVGPRHTEVPRLTRNVELLPACAHPDAMQHMARFAVGLIPFKKNALTAAVDPVKYYEYRALGMPVVSTAFGEMPLHARDDSGVVLAEEGSDPAALLRSALAHRDDEATVAAFREINAWSARFATADQDFSRRR